MEVFGWFSLIILALIGTGTIAAFIGPNAVEKIKTIIYQAKKFAQVAKEHTDAKAEIKKAKNAAKLNKEPVENTEAKVEIEVATPVVETPKQEEEVKVEAVDTTPVAVVAQEEVEANNVNMVAEEPTPVVVAQPVTSTPTSTVSHISVQ